MLVLKNLSLKLPNMATPILDDLSLALEQGDFLVLLGSNGSGKSSLIRLINGLMAPSTGEIALEGSLVCQSMRGRQLIHHSIEQRAQTIATLSQDLSLATFTDLSVWENCLLATKGNKHPAVSSHKSLQQHLAGFHHALPSRLHAPVGRLSGGERQSLALAMVFLSKPRLLLLDEHTSALDPQAGQHVMKLTAQQVRKHDMTVVMTTHDLEDALRYGNRLAILRQGKLLHHYNAEEKQQLTKEEVLALY